MFRHLTPNEQQALTTRLTARGVTPEQFEQAKDRARVIGEALARAYGEAIGRPVTPVRFVTDVLGIEGAGRLLVCALRETTGRPDLYRDV
ncbi:hypothetical protein [Streptomyces aurantiogriseus]|uniref:Uncharacterized protein n=1 Tax=Streptomyces aurantiogriseus TaxID=66870 RepID=A0A918F736_9ACTN|nr:hypothetical protein [Streptomyces aurantiogriseus]GGR06679.1 hypothetical protein GCM10010251_23060 [Streptomyces aurantiogriseus]